MGVQVAPVQQDEAIRPSEASARSSPAIGPVVPEPRRLWVHPATARMDRARLPGPSCPSVVARPPAAPLPDRRCPGGPAPLSPAHLPPRQSRGCPRARPRSRFPARSETTSTARPAPLPPARWRKQSCHCPKDRFPPLLTSVGHVDAPDAVAVLVTFAARLVHSIDIALAIRVQLLVDAARVQVGDDLAQRSCATRDWRQGPGG